MNSQITNITNIKKYLDLQEIPFVFIQTPHLIPTDDDLMIPAGYETNINANSDRLLKSLENNGITYLDLRKKFKENEINHYDVFYRTDHHWTTEAGFISHKYIAEFIDQQLGQNIRLDEYFVDSRYEFDVKKNISLGSRGQRTGIYFAGVDDVLLITPRFETNFTVETRLETKNGDFKEVHLNYSHLINDPTNFFTENTHKTFSELIDYVKIINHDAKNDKVIMILRDSFTRTLGIYLSLHYKEVHLYDVRYGDKQDGFIKKLHEINPDIVLQVRITSDVLNDEAKNELINR